MVSTPQYQTPLILHYSINAQKHRHSPPLVLTASRPLLVQFSRPATINYLLLFWPAQRFFGSCTTMRSRSCTEWQTRFCAQRLLSVLFAVMSHEANSIYAGNTRVEDMRPAQVNAFTKSSTAIIGQGSNAKSRGIKTMSHTRHKVRKLGNLDGRRQVTRREAHH